MPRSNTPAAARTPRRYSQASGARAQSRAEKPTMRMAPMSDPVRRARRWSGSNSSAYGNSGDLENGARTGPNESTRQVPVPTRPKRLFSRCGKVLRTMRSCGGVRGGGAVGRLHLPLSMAIAGHVAYPDALDENGADRDSADAPRNDGSAALANGRGLRGRGGGRGFHPLRPLLSLVPRAQAGRLLHLQPLAAPPARLPRLG